MIRTDLRQQHHARPPPIKLLTPRSPLGSATMTSKRPLRSLVSTASSSLRPAQISRTSFVRSSACAFSSTTPSRSTEYDAEVTPALDRPRWKQTPPRMMAPHRIRPKARGGVYQVNEDPKKLDDAYIRMLGPGGDKILGEDVKWLAVTHKSFDHGRRGFNDRLAYLGMCAHCKGGQTGG